MALIVLAAEPNALRLRMLLNVVCGKVAVAPDGMDVVWYRVRVVFVVVCLEAGQLATPVNKQLTPLVVTLVLRVVVVKSCRFMTASVMLASFGADFADAAHTFASVVV